MPRSDRGSSAIWKHEGMPAAVPDKVTEKRRTRGRPGHDREAVLRAAIALFNRQGYEATSISDIAADLGVTKSAIYHHYESKEALLSAALDEALDSLASAVDEAAEATRDGSTRDRLRATIANAVEILAEHLPAVTLLLRVRGNSPLERSALERRRHIDERLAVLVRAAVAQGELRTDLDPGLISRLVFGLINSLVDWYRPDGPITPEALAGHVVDVLFAGLQRG